MDLTEQEIKDIQKRARTEYKMRMYERAKEADADGDYEKARIFRLKADRKGG